MAVHTTYMVQEERELGPRHVFFFFAWILILCSGEDSPAIPTPENRMASVIDGIEWSSLFSLVMSIGDNTFGKCYCSPKALTGLTWFFLKETKVSLPE